MSGIDECPMTTTDLTVTAVPSLRTVMRPLQPVAPEDSLGRALRILQRQMSSSLPVLRNGRLVGIVVAADITRLALEEPHNKTESKLEMPVSEVLRPADITVSATASMAEMRQLCAAREVEAFAGLPVVDERGYCFGTVRPYDLIASEPLNVRPANIGGMATPFGVYLYDGNIQAGVGNIALAASGAMMALMLLAANFLVAHGLLLLVHSVPPLYAKALNPDYEATGNQPVLGLISLGARLLNLIAFFVIMRISMLAGYHAAEHQTVHAMEHDEPLVPTIVSRMPRIHPRCGTNLMAAAIVFMSLKSLFENIPFAALNDSALVLAGLSTLFTWRKVGSFLQNRFTTRRPTDRQLASGISAGTELMLKYMHSPPARPSFLRRVWCTGLLQSLAGMMLALGIAAIFQ